MCSRLVALKAAVGWINDIETAMDDLVEQGNDNPAMDFSVGIQQCSSLNNTLRSTLRESTIPLNHTLRDVAKEINKSIPTNYPGFTGNILQKTWLSRYPGTTMQFPVSSTKSF